MVHSTAHALVIDDDALNLEIMSHLLAYENVTCTTVQDATDLPSILTTIPSIEVVFLDLEMPSIDGYGVLHYLKQEVGITAPIVACTVHVAEANNAREHGFDSFLPKPINAEAFSDQLAKILNGERVWIVRPD